MRQVRSFLLLTLGVIFIAGCTPPVGSEAWCKQMKSKDAGNWTVNEATDYAKHCVFKTD